MKGSNEKNNKLIAPKAIEEITFAEFNAKTVAKLKPAERLVVAERTMFLSTAEGKDESEFDFLARLREAARYCKSLKCPFSQP